MNARKEKELKKQKQNRIKMYIFYLALPFILLLLFKALNAEPRNYDDIDNAEINLPSIVCEKCAKTIENTLINEEGVESIKVKIEIRKAIISFHHLKTSISKLEKAINKAGYDANDKKADKKAYDKLADCCRKK